MFRANETLAVMQPVQAAVLIKIESFQFIDYLKKKKQSRNVLNLHSLPDPTSDLIDLLCKQVPNEFMVSGTGLESSSIPHDVHFVHFGPIQIKIAGKEGNAWLPYDKQVAIGFVPPSTRSSKCVSSGSKKTRW